MKPTKTGEEWNGQRAGAAGALLGNWRIRGWGWGAWRQAAPLYPAIQSFNSGPGTTSTGQGRRRTTFSAVDPKKISSMGPRPAWP